MNLFTEYTEEEIEFLLSLTNNKYINLKKEVKFLENIDDYVIDKEIKKITVKEFDQKKVIEDNYDLLYVIDGEIVILKDSKIIKKIKNDEVFGINKLLHNESYYLVTIKNTKICFMELKSKKSVLIKLLDYTVKKCCEQKIV